MMTIHEYMFAPSHGILKLEMPHGAKILSLQAQRNLPCLWALVDAGHAPTTRYFYVAHTGVPFGPEGLEHVGTVQLDGGDRALHVFEIVGECRMKKPSGSGFAPHMPALVVTPQGGQRLLRDRLSCSRSVVAEKFEHVYTEKEATAPGGGFMRWRVRVEPLSQFFSTPMIAVEEDSTACADKDLLLLDLEAARWLRGVLDEAIAHAERTASKFAERA